MPPAKVPTFDRLMNPLIQALKELGGSGTIQEINAKTAEIAGLSEEILSVLHDPESGSQTEVEYRLAWTRTYLKKYGILENSSRGVWALTPAGVKTARIDPTEVKQVVRAQDREERQSLGPADNTEAEETHAERNWQDDLMDAVLAMSPDAFERLAQRILRESNFIQVEVTGRSGDGGIDGRGIMQLGGLLSFRVIFQCKRYQGSVSSSQVRDFRGAMVGRAEKGLFITTGTFTSDAKKEATRDGAPPIDLIDGEKLLEILKLFRLGVKTEIVQVERVTIDRDWFSGI